MRYKDRSAESRRWGAWRGSKPFIYQLWGRWKRCKLEGVPLFSALGIAAPRHYIANVANVGSWNLLLWREGCWAVGIFGWTRCPDVHVGANTVQLTSTVVFPPHCAGLSWVKWRLINLIVACWLCGEHASRKHALWMPDAMWSDRWRVLTQHSSQCTGTLFAQRHWLAVHLSAPASPECRLCKLGRIENVGVSHNGVQGRSPGGDVRPSPHQLNCNVRFMLLKIRSLMCHRLFSFLQCCSPRDQSLGLQAPRGQTVKSWSWSWQYKSWEFSRLFHFLIASKIKMT